MPRLLLVLDADSTLLCDEVIELIAEEAGRRDEVAAVTESAMRGEIDFATSLRQRVSALADVPVAALSRVIERVRPTPGAEELIAAVHERGGVVGVVSGGFHEVLDTIAPRLGVDVWQANRLGVAGGSLSGTVEGPIIDAGAKATWLRAWAAEFSATTTIAIGDGANDLHMLATADLGLAFNAKPRVRQAADLIIGPVDLRAVIAVLPAGGIAAQ